MTHADFGGQVQPAWMRTGYKCFPYAARQSGRWWLLRFNFGFPAHDMYTLFIDGQLAADVTGDDNSPIPLVASIGALKPLCANADEPMLDPQLAETIVNVVAQYVTYGSEVGDRCICCDREQDPLTRLS